jgi:3-deoxy-manno-octulosonate cytidylyltransferase (CMP-KDO synthetase)
MEEAALAIPSATVAGVIPARFDSTRLPGKVLALIGDRTVLHHVHDRAAQSKQLDRLLVATDDDRILREVLAFGGVAVMTAREHSSGTERVAEAVASLENRPALVINIQGDEPFLDPRTIDELAGALRSDPTSIWTAVSGLEDGEALARPEVVKAARSEDGRVLYFSRAPIPYVRHRTRRPAHWRHVGIYGYAAGVLERLVRLPESALERTEGLEQLRWLEAGIPVRSVTVESRGFGIDTEEDLKRARAFWEARAERGGAR